MTTVAPDFELEAIQERIAGWLSVEPELGFMEILSRLSTHERTLLAARGYELLAEPEEDSIVARTGVSVAIWAARQESIEPNCFESDFLADVGRAGMAMVVNHYLAEILREEVGADRAQHILIEAGELAKDYAGVCIEAVVE